MEDNNIKNETINEVDENGNPIPGDQSTDMQQEQQKPKTFLESLTAKAREIGPLKILAGAGLIVGGVYVGRKVLKAAKAASAPVPSITTTANAAEQVINSVPTDLSAVGLDQMAQATVEAASKADPDVVTTVIDAVTVEN